MTQKIAEFRKAATKISITELEEFSTPFFWSIEMTQPRRHIAGQIALLTRRCSERRYFLRPDDYINEVAPFEVGKAHLPL